MLVYLCLVVNIWLKLRASPGSYMDKSRRREVQRHVRFMTEKVAKYTRRVDRDRAAAKDMVSGGWGGMWGTLFTTGGRLVIWGAVITVLVAGIAWSIELQALQRGVRPGMVRWY